MILEKETVQEFRKNGATALPGAFAGWVDMLRAGVAWNMETPSSDVRIYYGEKETDGSGKFFGDYCNWQRIPEYEKFIFNSPAAKLASQLMGAETVQLFHEHVFVKEAMGSEKHGLANQNPFCVYAIVYPLSPAPNRWKNG